MAKAGDGVAVREEDATPVGAVEDTVGIPAELVLGGGDVHLGGAGFQLAAHVVFRDGLAAYEQGRARKDQ